LKSNASGGGIDEVFSTTRSFPRRAAGEYEHIGDPALCGGAGKKNGGSPYGWRSASSDKIVSTCYISEEPTAVGHTQQEISIARSSDEQACRNACLDGEESQRA